MAGRPWPRKKIEKKIEGLTIDSAEKPSYAFFLFGLGRWRVSHSL